MHYAYSYARMYTQQNKKHFREEIKMKKFKKLFLAIMVLTIGVISTVLLVGCNKVPTVANVIESEEVEEYALAVKKGNSKILGQINEFLALPDTKEFISTSIAFHKPAESGEKIDYSKAPIKASVLKDNKGATITMLTEASFAPYEYVLNSGDSQVNGVAGSDVDLMIAFCEKYDYKLKVEQYLFDSIIPTLQQDSTGLMVGAAGMTITPDRAEKVDFSDPYTTSQQAIISLKETGYKTLEELAGKTVGVQSGTTGELVIKKYNEANPKAKITIKPYPKFTQAFMDLKQQAIDAVVADKFVAFALVAKG